MRSHPSLVVYLALLTTVANSSSSSSSSTSSSSTASGSSTSSSSTSSSSTALGSSTSSSSNTGSNAVGVPAPPIWPEQFKAVLFMNQTNKLALTTLYYDFKLGANLNVIASQLGSTVYDLEWNNGTSFIFSQDEPVCKTLHFDVGILVPDWLANATYLGATAADTFLVDVFTKAEFINYYAEQSTQRPVRWTFLWTGAEYHVLQWNVGETLPKKQWQAPPYCFTNPNGSSSSTAKLDEQPLASGRMYRLKAAQQVEAAAHERQQQQQLLHASRRRR